MLEVAKPCNVGTCVPTSGNADCLFGDWADWSDCPGVCGGSRTRSRDIAADAAGQGSFCDGLLEEAEACESCAGPDCSLSEWGDWSECSRSCDGGHQTRTRYVLTEPGPGGVPCVGALSETWPCMEASCGKSSDASDACVWDDWSDWGRCSVLCFFQFQVGTVFFPTSNFFKTKRKRFENHILKI